MKIRVLRDYTVPGDYCNDCSHYEHTKGLFSTSRCTLFKCKIRMDGLNAVKSSDCVESARRVVETGCEFCEGDTVAGYRREYIGNDLRPANPPFCPECGRKRR